MKNERLSNIFSSSPFETRLMVSMMEAVLGDDKLEKILNDLEAPSFKQDVIIEGRPLRYYSGLTEQQLDALGLSDEGKEKLWEYYDKPASAKKSKEETSETETPRVVESTTPKDSKSESTKDNS